MEILKFKLTFIFLLISLFSVFGAEVYIFDIYGDLLTHVLTYYPDSLYSLLDHEGHQIYIDTDTTLDEISSYDIIYCSFPETLYQEDVLRIQDFVGSGGLAIFWNHGGSSPYGRFRYTNGILEDRIWRDSLGYIHINETMTVDSSWEYYPWDSLELFFGEVFPNVLISSGYFSGVDTIITLGSCSVSILSPDSGTAETFIWGRYGCYTLGGEYRHNAVLSVIAEYGLGKLIVIPNMFSRVVSFGHYDTSICILNLADNRQFFRNLFTTNDRADRVWLTGTDSTFTVFLPGCTPFVTGSTSFSFESVTYGLWELRASDWCYWHTDSSITIQYPDTCPMSVTFEVCVNLVPDSTGETVLPTGPVCDSFAFNYTGIAETPTPAAFAISAHPNPFNSSVTISLYFGSESAPWDFPSVKKPLSTIEIFDVNGRRVVEITPPAPLNRGEHGKSPLSKGDLGGLFVWRPDESIGSGVYLVRARFGPDGSSARDSDRGEQTVTRRVVYLK